MRSCLTDELIRQVTINCAERGLLLLRVRDEIRMTIAAYQTLYESSIAFGMRKALMAEQRKAELEAKVRRRSNCTVAAPLVVSCFVLCAVVVTNCAVSIALPSVRVVAAESFLARWRLYCRRRSRSCRLSEWTWSSK